jgi:hypothetical protein
MSVLRKRFLGIRFLIRRATIDLLEIVSAAVDGLHSAKAIVSRYAPMHRL